MVDGKPDLSKQKVGVTLPGRQRREGRRHPEAEPRREAVLEAASLFDHGPHGEVVRPPARLGPVAVDEQELVHSVGGGRQQVTTEAEGIAVPGVQAGDGSPAHVDDLVGYSDARDSGSANVVVRD